MENYKPESIRQPYLPGMEKREVVGNRRLVLERTVADFWASDMFNVASQIREFFVVGYNDEEHRLLQSAWGWVQEGGFLEDAGETDSELPLEVLLNCNTVFFWTGMKEALRNPGLGDFPVACKAGTDVWRNDIRDTCGEFMHRARGVAAGELHKRGSVSHMINSITEVEKLHGPFRGLTDEAIIRTEKVDLITYTLLVDYYMTLIKRGRELSVLFDN